MAERAAERYVLLLESAYDNGKLCSFSHRAFRLWVNSLSYARKHRTDGHLTPNQAAVLLRLYGLNGKDVDELIEKGGWDRVEDGYRIHDFLDVNVSEDQIRNLSTTRATAGRAGGIRSGAVRRGETIDDVTQPPATGDIKNWARNQANSALRRGLLAKRDCEQCGAAPVEMHHDDYSRPLDVRWLCPTCHKRVHVAIRAEASASADQPIREGASEASASPNASKHLEGASKPIEADVDIDVDREGDTDTPTHGDRGETRLLAAHAPVSVLVPKARQQREYPADFEAWWTVYPNKESKFEALKSWRQRVKAGRTAEALRSAAEHLAAYVREHGTPIDKIPHGSTFLNQHRDEGWEHGPPNGAARPAMNGHAARPQRESPMEQATRLIAARREREAS